MNEKLRQALELYMKTFNDSFPTMSLRGCTEDRMIEIINDCVARKQNVYDAGYLVLSDDILY